MFHSSNANIMNTIMRHHIHQIILLFVLCCISVRSVAQAPSGFDYHNKEQVEETIGQEEE